MYGFIFAELGGYGLHTSSYLMYGFCGIAINWEVIDYIDHTQNGAQACLTF